MGYFVLGSIAFLAIYKIVGKSNDALIIFC